MSNPTFKPSEGKREEFRKYLEKNGVMDALTKVLVNLYEEPEKPEDALEFIRDKLALQAGIETYNEMKGKHDELQAKISDLEEELEQIKLSQEPPPVEEGETPAAPVGEEEGETAPPGEEAPVPDQEPPTEETTAPAEEPPEQSEPPQQQQQ